MYRQIFCNTLDTSIVASRGFELLLNYSWMWGNVRHVRQCEATSIVASRGFTLLLNYSWMNKLQRQILSYLTHGNPVLIPILCANINYYALTLLIIWRALIIVDSYYMCSSRAQRLMTLTEFLQFTLIIIDQTTTFKSHFLFETTSNNFKMRWIQ